MPGAGFFQGTDRASQYAQMCVGVQGGLDERVEVKFCNVLHWLRCLQPGHAALVIFENVEDALVDSSKAQVTYYATGAGHF